MTGMEKGGKAVYQILYPDILNFFKIPRLKFYKLILRHYKLSDLITIINTNLPPKQ